MSADDEDDAAEQDGAANGSQPFSSGNKFNVRGGWLPSLTFAFGKNMSSDKSITEARARIIWGEPSSSVRDFLISNGVSVAVADAKLQEFEAERSRELRRIGFRNVLIGAVLTGAAGITLYLTLPSASATSGIIQA